MYVYMTANTPMLILAMRSYPPTYTHNTHKLPQMHMYSTHSLAHTHTHTHTTQSSVCAHTHTVTHTLLRHLCVRTRTHTHILLSHLHTYTCMRVCVCSHTHTGSDSKKVLLISYTVIALDIFQTSVTPIRW